MDDPYIMVARPFGLTIWHKDPRKKNHPDPGSHGDTAGWTWARLDRREMDYADYLAGGDGNDFDNLLEFFPGKDPEQARGHIRQIFRLHKTLTRPWWRHPRWQFWNWRLRPNEGE